MFEPIKNEELKWIGCDFDGTLAKPSTPPTYPIQEPQPGAKEFVDALIEMKLKPSIFTARPNADYMNLERWHQFYEIMIRRITTGKDLYLWQLDDKAIEFDPKRPQLSFERALKIIQTGKLPW